MLNVPAHWRIKPSPAEQSAFGAGEHGRALRIVIDSDTAPAGPALDLLRELSKRPSVEVFATDDSALGRIEFGPVDEQYDVVDIKYVLPDELREAALFSARSLRSRAQTISAEYGLDEESTWRGLVLAEAGRRHQLDAVVCAAPVLDTEAWSANARRAHVMRSEDACGLLGLCLRAHNDFTVSVLGNGSTFVRFDQFYRGAASAALPNFSNWLAATWAIRDHADNRRPLELLRAVEARIGRALIARDYVDVRIRHWRPDETWGEVLYFFESLLLSLGGALDALARVLDSGLALSGARDGIGFRKKAWREKLAKRSSTMAEVLADGSHFRATVDMVATLRNYIHEEVLSSELVSDSGSPDIMDYGLGVLALTRDAASDLHTAAPNAGGAIAWGIEEKFDGATTVMPILFQRAALTNVLGAIREVMKTNLLPDIAPAQTRPFAESYWLPLGHLASRLCLLAGLTDAST